MLVYIMCYLLSYSFRNLKIKFEVPNLYYLVYGLLREIPKGKITTYGILARILGDVRASRAIGRILSKNKYPDEIPCFKVIKSDGTLGGYTSLGGISDKINRLLAEKISINGNTVRDYKKYLYTGIGERDPHVLESLRRIQDHLSRRVILLDENKKSIERIIVTDASYIDASIPEIGFGVAALIDLPLQEILAVSISITPVFFPYIPGYLAFREAPPILAAIDALKGIVPEPEVFIFDGHGILHPRKIGLAAHLGVLLNKPAIGVAKRILVGKISSKKYFLDEKKMVSRAVTLNNVVMGYSITKGGKKEIIVSPGNKISPETALKIIISMPWSRKYPDPLYFTHLIANMIREKFLKNIMM